MARSLFKHVMVASLVAAMSTGPLAWSTGAPATAVEPKPTPINAPVFTNVANDQGGAVDPEPGAYQGPIISTLQDKYRFPLSTELNDFEDIDIWVTDPSPFETIRVHAYGFEGAVLEQDLQEKKWELKVPVTKAIGPVEVTLIAFGPQEFETRKTIWVQVADPSQPIIPDNPVDPQPTEPTEPTPPDPVDPNPNDPVDPSEPVPVPPDTEQPTDPTPPDPSPTELPVPEPTPSPTDPSPSEPPVIAPEPENPEVPKETNQTPVIHVSDQTFTVGRYNYFDVTVTDPDGDNIKDFTTTYLSGVQVYNLTPNTWRIMFASWMPVGEYTMWLHAEDVNGGESAAKVKVTLTRPLPPPNQGPAIWIANEATFFNNVQNRIPFRVVDPDGDTIHHVNFSSHPYISTEFRGGDRFDLVFAAGIAPGVYKVTLNGVDWKGNVGPNVVVAVTIKAPAVNYGPEVQVTNVAFDNSVARTVRFTVTDRDGDAIANVWWNRRPGWTLAHVSGNTWEIRIPARYLAGTYNLTLWATDARGATGPASHAYVTITNYVPPAPINRAPVITGGQFYIYAGRPHYRVIGAYDPDGDPVYLRLRQAPSWMALYGGTLTARAPYWERGTHRVIVEASDGKVTSQGVFDVTVIGRWGYR